MIFPANHLTGAETVCSQSINWLACWCTLQQGRSKDMSH